MSLYGTIEEPSGKFQRFENAAPSDLFLRVPRLCAVPFLMGLKPPRLSGPADKCRAVGRSTSALDYDDRPFVPPWTKDLYRYNGRAALDPGPMLRVAMRGPGGHGLRHQSTEGARAAVPALREEPGSAASLEFTKNELSAARDELLLESAYALVAAVEAKDPYTRNHSFNVAGLAIALARRMNLPPRLLATIRIAAMLHDIGKIGVPDVILHKPGPLTDDEFDVVKTHPCVAARILRPVRLLADVRRVILHHHERIDGTGYPAGLRGEQIPIGARILSVADAVDAMLSPRSYKSPYPLHRVREELTAGAGHQFDRTVIKVALEWLDEQGAFLNKRHGANRRSELLNARRR